MLFERNFSSAGFIVGVGFWKGNEQFVPRKKSVELEYRREDNLYSCKP
jgi:hypothetical protein